MIVKWLFEIRDQLNQTQRGTALCLKKKKPTPAPPPFPLILYKEENEEEENKGKKRQTDMVTLKTDKKQNTGDLNIHESYNREKRPGDEVDPTKVLKELY